MCPGASGWPGSTTSLPVERTATRGLASYLDEQGAPFEYFDDFHAIEHTLGHATPVDPLTPGVRDGNAVEEDDGASFVHAADGDDLRRAADQAARARQFDAGHFAQQVLRLTRWAGLDLLCAQHVHRGRNAIGFGRSAGRGDDHAGQQQRSLGK